MSILEQNNKQKVQEINNHISREQELDAQLKTQKTKEKDILNELEQAKAETESFKL